MPESAAGLVGAMVGRGPAHSARNRQRRNCALMQKSNRFIDRARAFFRPNRVPPGSTITLPFIRLRISCDESGVERGVLAGQIHLANNGGA